MQKCIELLTEANFLNMLYVKRMGSKMYVLAKVRGTLYIKFLNYCLSPAVFARKY
jgi:hypothetical protein